MTEIHALHALLPTGWAAGVRIAIDESGSIERFIDKVRGSPTGNHHDYMETLERQKLFQTPKFRVVHYTGPMTSATVAEGQTFAIDFPEFKGNADKENRIPEKIAGAKVGPMMLLGHLLQ